MRILLGVVLPDPFGQARRGFPRINLDLRPVSLLQQFCIGEPDLLRASCAGESAALVREAIRNWS